MAEVTFVKAERKQVKLRVGLIGPSGSGKTYTALRLAKGMGLKTVLIDTEHRRSEYYATEFAFDVLHLDPPFTPERFNEAIAAAEKAGYQLIVVDSASHEWAGAGGILEIHDSMTGNRFVRWKILTPRHRSFIDKINYSSVHMILTVRGKDVYVLEENDKGKQVPKKIGMGAEQRQGFEYEMTCSLMLDVHTHGITVEKDNTHIFDKHYAALTEEQGKQLLAWAQSGIAAQAPAAPPPAPEGQTDQKSAGQDGNGNKKDPARKPIIAAIAEMVQHEELFSPEERDEYRARVKKTATAGLMVLKLEIAKTFEERKKIGKNLPWDDAPPEVTSPPPQPAAQAATTSQPQNGLDIW